MSKGVKIKRYNRIYGGRSPLQRVLRGLAALFAVAVLGFAGWSAYGPVMEYLEKLSDKEAAVSSSEQASSSTPESAAPEEEESLPAAEPIQEAYQAVYLPVSLLTNGAALDAALGQLPAGTNAVLIDLKNAAGGVPYTSSLEAVQKAGAQLSGAYDLSAVCTKFAEKNLRVIGRMHAFRDPIAASKVENAGVKYMNTDMLWLDNSANEGGKPWLNPYSTEARGYLQSILSEAVAMGVTDILLDSVSFPTGYGQQFSAYGDTAGVSKADALSSFTAEMEKLAGESGANLSVYISALAALNDGELFYGGNPLSLYGGVTLGVMPALFGDGYTAEGFSLQTPLLNPGQTVDALLKFLAPRLEGKQVAALVQGYTETKELANNKPYTAEDIKAQADALAQNGVESYIVYSPDGNYPQ